MTMQLRTEYKACPAKAICKDIGKLPDGTEKHSDYKGVLYIGPFCQDIFFDSLRCSLIYAASRESSRLEKDSYITSGVR